MDADSEQPEDENIIIPITEEKSETQKFYVPCQWQTCQGSEQVCLVLNPAV